MSIHNSKQISDVKILLKTGVDGVGIVDIEKTGTQGITDTYTITLSNGTKYTFTVTNGNGIVSIEKTGSQGLVDTFTITFDDGSTQTFTVTNGNGIESIEKTQTVGLVDTYTITFTDGTTTTFDVTNGSGGGLDPHIIVISNTGSTVTLTKGSNVITAVETSAGYFETDVPEYGAWQIDSVLAGDTVTKTLVVDTAKVYTIDASHFSATITVTYPSGATCTCVGGSESYTATNNPETFTVHSANTFTITATDGTNTDTETVVISTSGQTETVTLSFVPEGSTVTPTDDIQIWLNCADIFDKSYTTIGEVLADSSTLSALIADSNAVDYMARSTSWASSVTANSTAMTYIGNNNYCANSLLANSTWLNAIRNSTYFESVLKVKVPTMTSNTAPSGKAVATSATSGYEAYKAFDNNDNTFWKLSGDGALTGHIGYMFPNAVNVKKAIFKFGFQQTTLTFVFQLRFSDDGSSWTNIGNSQSFYTSGNIEVDFEVNPNAGHKYWDVLITTTGSYAPMSTKTVQFYGRTS